MMKIVLGISFILFVLILNNQLTRMISRVGHRKKVSRDRVFYVQKTLQLTILVVGILTASVIFGFNYDKFGLIFSSIFAVVGIALFAQWSILSNITASIMIFFFFPYRVGNRVRINEDKDWLSGEIIEITLFHVLIRMDDNNILSYPNSLVFQKAIIIEPKNKKSLPSKDTV
ncbi:mechanosensitive ion channel family protein [Bermanella marisrubri]|uniref:Small-conductance mechanosensitive channel n=1 Tax=Bermanella marisrubri TaxID=207949 RepID=Q1N0J8_9GAMM|nr:mechanosensitive ion channel domain-containing protein [Bermanella marisrubri]EAT11835.1 hypothetical protein RED65_05594 [Oceanobacter sp. RED65] [Bermanella marisrubri]QIZ83869.1 mechanosensitive ion channel family protein [Bermanella marisrubri]